MQNNSRACLNHITLTTRKWRMVDTEELRNLYLSPNIVWVVKSRGINLTESI